ncbi:MAG: hypothetical protein PHQ12_03465 [Chthoniobacteraceae bacterium]|nr:hypothetical protein [Chthoniobacteraceae bacterium]
MNRTSIKSIGLALTLLTAPYHVQAQNGGDSAKTPEVSTGGHLEPIPIESEPGLQTFLEAYIAANNAKDIEKIKELNHPKDLDALRAFFASHKPAAFAGTFEKVLLRGAIPENHPPFIVQRYRKDSPLPQAGWMEWPVPPTHQVQFTVKTATGPNSYDSSSFVIELVHADKRWFVLHGVPGPKMLEMIKGK